MKVTHVSTERDEIGQKNKCDLSGERELHEVLFLITRLNRKNTKKRHKTKQNKCMMRNVWHNKNKLSISVCSQLREQVCVISQGQ